MSYQAISLECPYKQHRTPRKYKGCSGALHFPLETFGIVARELQRTQDIKLSALLTSGNLLIYPCFRTSHGIFIVLPKINGLGSLWEKPSAAQPSRAGSGITHWWQGLRGCVCCCQGRGSASSPSSLHPPHFPTRSHKPDLSLFSPPQLLLSFVHIITNSVLQEFPEKEVEKKGRRRKHEQ